MRSKYEVTLATSLRNRKVKYKYEKRKIKYTLPEKTYTPDFELPNGIIIEAKGVLSPADRTKMRAVKAQHPELDIRFVFMNARNKLGKGSKTTYGQWATKHGFVWAHKRIPDEWTKK
jgi:hypothetical protein